jgi:hypothetical protein
MVVKELTRVWIFNWNEQQNQSAELLCEKYLKARLSFQDCKRSYKNMSARGCEDMGRAELRQQLFWVPTVMDFAISLVDYLS